MAMMQIEDLVRIMRDCAGEADAVDLDGKQVRYTPLEELGYDSLALMETASQVEREYHVSLPEEVVAAFVTPDDILAAVNASLGTAV